MHVNLTPHYTQYVARKVKTGRYNNASEVIRAALIVVPKNPKHPFRNPQLYCNASATSNAA